ncbi:hypothetical protein JXA12_05025 [Candidatus Woesearchaeota archaeon]|nr:hypothetical protein [Candidatus Woesearchaeota archaeon]
MSFLERIHALDNPSSTRPLMGLLAYQHRMRTGRDVSGLLLVYPDMGELIASYTHGPLTRIARAEVHVGYADVLFTCLRDGLLDGRLSSYERKRAMREMASFERGVGGALSVLLDHYDGLFFFADSLARRRPSLLSAGDVLRDAAAAGEVLRRLYPDAAAYRGFSDAAWRVFEGDARLSEARLPGVVDEVAAAGFLRRYRSVSGGGAPLLEEVLSGLRALHEKYVCEDVASLYASAPILASAAGPGSR